MFMLRGILVAAVSSSVDPFERQSRLQFAQKESAGHETQPITSSIGSCNAFDIGESS